MKRIGLLILTVAMSLLLLACTANTARTAKEIADEIVNNTVFSEELSEVSQNALLRRYGIEESQITDCAGYSGTRAVVDEVAVFITDDVDLILAKVNAHIDSQKTNYSSYAPNEMPKLENAVVEVLSDRVIVCISDNETVEIETIIDSAFK